MDLFPSSAYMNELVDEYIQNTKITEELVKHIEEATREEPSSHLRMLLHNGRITSSNFREIMHSRETTNKENIIKRIMGYSPSFPRAATYEVGEGKRKDGTNGKHREETRR